MLNPGTRLGPYEISAPLGAGGMGEVYRARDTRLGREVAIKVLPPHLSDSPELRSRFEREARTVSALNHPHICVLHDVGREADTDFLVMELVQGETLAARLQKGPLPAADVLRVGAEIADALDRAHRAGVIHRDLKPGNVMLTRAGAKLMDFGLARATVRPAALEEGTAAPTATQPLTAQGTLMGTFQYMAPEQLEGKEADARSDLWALGCVLYEMATGRPAFAGTSQASLIGRIMHAEPAPMAELAPMSPPALERLVRACLVKDPEERVQTAHDLGLQLRWIAEGGSQAGIPAPVAARRRVRERVAWALAVAGLAAALALAVALLWSRSREGDPIQATLTVPDSGTLSPYAAGICLSPDGQNLAFTLADSLGEPWLWVRSLGTGVARRLPEARDAYWPFWSPDGKEIGFFTLAEGKLKRIALAGGGPTTICDAPGGRGGAWRRDGVILFSPEPHSPILRVSAGGGLPVALTTLDSTRNETGHRFPAFLPDGEHFLLASLPTRPDGWDIHVASLRDGSRKRLMTAESTPVYSATGHLLFGRGGRLLAQRFDARGLRLIGDPQPVADTPPKSDLDAEPVVSVSRDGRRIALLRDDPLSTRLEVVDAAGAVRRAFSLPAAPWVVVDVTSDGRRAALLNRQEIWVVDLERSVPMRLDMSTASTPSVVWSPDGSRLAFGARQGPREEIRVAGLDGRAETLPSTDEEFKMVEDWSSDGKYLLYRAYAPATAWDLWILPLEGDRRPRRYVAGPVWDTNAKVSPNGRWVAYSSNETGSWEVYVQSFPEPGLKVRVSPDGGGFPEWGAGGRELSYFRGVTLMTVQVEDGAEFRPSRPRPGFTFARTPTGARRLPGGRDWLVSTPTAERRATVDLIVDWSARLRR